MALLDYMGNDPRVFSLYFTCKTLYGKYIIKRDAKTGFERFLNLGCSWNIPLSCLEGAKVQNFFKILFHGYIVCDMFSLNAIFNLCDGRYFRIPLPCVRYFYFVKYKNGDIRMKKYPFYHKMNVISVNDSGALGNPSKIQCRVFMCVYGNYEIHSDSFILGCKFSSNGIMLTSHFSLGKMNFLGITCYPSFRQWVKNSVDVNYRLLKRYFCYSAFRNQVMAMFQCKKCFKILYKMLLKMTSFGNLFPVFKSKVKFNPNKLLKEVNMTQDFYGFHSYVNSDELSRPLNHLHNGELLHDCYYDVENSDLKLIFFNSFKCFKMYGNEWILSSPHVYEFSNNFFHDSTGINLVKGNRDLQYFRFVKQTFDCYTTF